MTYLFCEKGDMMTMISDLSFISIKAPLNRSDQAQTQSSVAASFSNGLVLTSTFLSYDMEPLLLGCSPTWTGGVTGLEVSCYALPTNHFHKVFTGCESRKSFVNLKCLCAINLLY